jgi:hypothetical protein
MKNWRALIERKDEITQYIPGHWNGELSFAGFQARYEYLKTLLADIKAMAKAGDDFNRFVAAYTLKDKFPQLVGSPGISNQGHQMSVKHLYQVYSGKKWLVGDMQGMIMGDRFAAEFPALKADILKNREASHRGRPGGLGYLQLQQLKKFDDAVRMFSYVELFPGLEHLRQLAEAHTKGEKQSADALQKSPS